MGNGVAVRVAHGRVGRAIGTIVATAPAGNRVDQENHAAHEFNGGGGGMRGEYAPPPGRVTLAAPTSHQSGQLPNRPQVKVGKWNELSPVLFNSEIFLSDSFSIRFFSTWAKAHFRRIDHI